MLLSVIIRTYNEAKHLDSVLRAVSNQDCGHDVEIILVDSGSNDATVSIAKNYGCSIASISKNEFTFGRSLNLGCTQARGDVLVFVSGHCIPANRNWLRSIVEPVINGSVAYSYGRQIGGESSRFSECQLFKKHYPDHSAIPQSGFYCNNANAALSRNAWMNFPFDEQLTGLEDMALAKRIVDSGGSIGYVAEAAVYHLHDETWTAVKNRYEREAIALQAIMPEIQMTFGDFLRYWASAILIDIGAAIQERRAFRTAWQIIAFRFLQFWGSYRGNNEHRKLSQAMKDKYFYPK